VEQASVRERVEHALRAIEASDLGAFWLVDGDRALARARELDHAREPGPLHGRAVAWKDCYDVAGLPTTGGAPWRADAPPAAHSAPAVRRFEAAGAVSLGKLAMHQLAGGMMGQTPGRPPCRNPHSRELVPGGSSSGSAVAVAAGLVDHAPGTDAGGSVRQPAAMCGVVGFKPTWGEVPLAGCMPYAPSFDTAGPIARSVHDVAAAYAVLACRPPADLGRRLAGLRVGMLTGFFADEVSDVQRGPVEAVARALGAEPLDIGWTRAHSAVMTAVFLAEPSSYVLAHDPEPAGAAYDAGWHDDIARARELPAIEYLHALARLERFRGECARRVGAVDVMLAPSSICAPVPIDGPDQTRRLNALTKPFNGLRWPALALPCGRDEGGLPLSLQVIGLPGRDDDVLRAGAAVEALLAG